MVSVGRRKVAANQWLKLPDCCVLAAAMQAKAALATFANTLAEAARMQGIAVAM
jgi:rRNA-processing protein FCF1